MLRRHFAVLAALCLALPAWAEAPTANLSTGSTATPDPGPVATLALAWDLYELGLAREDAVILLTAVRLARQTSLRPATGWKTEVAPADATAAAPPAGLPRDPASEAALELALIMAEGDPEQADLAADVAADLAADLVRGRPGEGQLPSVTARIAGSGTDVYQIAFNGELPAEVALIGDGSGDLDLMVSDETGHLVCQDTSPGDRAFCAFTPARNGWFTVSVTNRAESGSNLYRLMTN